MNEGGDFYRRGNSRRRMRLHGRHVFYGKSIFREKKRRGGLSGIFFSLMLLLALMPVQRIQAQEAAAPDRGITINVYNWGEYIANGTDDSLDVNAEFTRRTGIRVNYTTFDSNESLYSKLVGGGADYDVIIPSDYMVSKLIHENMLAELDFSNIPNYQYIDGSFRNPDYDPENRYSVPYTWGVVGLFYNTDYIEEEITSWSALWDERYAGKILMFDNPRDSFAIAQILLGQSLHKAEAEAYINFLCDPEIAGENMNYVGYSTPETAAKAYMDQEMVASPVHYPDEEILARTQVFVNLPEDTGKLIDRLWAEAKMGGPGESAVLVAIILGFLAVYIAIIVGKRRRRKRELA